MRALDDLPPVGDEMARALRCAVDSGLLVEPLFDDDGFGLCLVVTCVPCPAYIWTPVRSWCMDFHARNVATFTADHCNGGDHAASPADALRA